MTRETQAPPRQIGFWIALALVVGNMIGSGIILLPANLAPYGVNALIGWGITIGGALCLAAVFAALARALPEAAGPYDYIASPSPTLAISTGLRQWAPRWRVGYA
jgi:APA family basic amino acid/polyamine antiporter